MINRINFKLSKYLIALLFVIPLLGFAIQAQIAAGENLPFTRTIVYEDNFTYTSDLEASTNWRIQRFAGDPLKEVVWDARGMVNLTVANTSLAGGIYLKNVDLREFDRWRLDFIAFIGNGNTSRHADGMTVVIYHNGEIGDAGSWLGAYSSFLRPNPRGYLIEFDTFYYRELMPVPHIAFSRSTNFFWNHIYVIDESSPILEKPIYVTIEFAGRRSGAQISGVMTLKVWDTVDMENKRPIGDPIVSRNFNVSITPQGPYIGFTAATGASYEYHTLYWMRLTLESPTPIVGGEASTSSGSGEWWLLAAVLVLVAATLLRLRF